MKFFVGLFFLLKYAFLKIWRNKIIVFFLLLNKKQTTPTLSVLLLKVLGLFVAFVM